MAKRVGSKHIEGISDLTLSSPIKRGFVPAIDNVTYESRLRMVMEAMFKIRTTAREYSKIKPFVESAERIQSLLDFRLAILDGQPKRLMLAVAFDKPFEPYMRLVWDPLGPLLDLFFCNCDKYVPAAESSFAAYLEWVRSVQIDSDFFYAASNLSIVDLDYLSQMERLHRDALMPNLDVIAASTCAESPVRRAKAVQARNGPETMDMGVQALVALSRLTDLYPPDDPQQGRFLHRAARQLLQDWDPSALPPAVKFKMRESLKLLEPYSPRRAEPERLTYDPNVVQAGIVNPYRWGGKPMTHGCLMLVRIRDAAAARSFLAGLRVSTEAAPDPEGDGIALTIAFTRSGLEALGVPQDQMQGLPAEFLDGMEARAGLLGDVGDSHPRRWRLPRRCRPSDDAPRACDDPPVSFAEVDIVLQLRTNSDYPGHEVVGDANHPLAGKVAELAPAGAPGVELLAVQSMRRAWLEDGSEATVAKDHFGFLDGFSQPVPIPRDGVPERDRVSIGELLVGYGNDRNDPPQKASDYWDNGTFLVLRKLEQDVAGLGKFLDSAAADLRRNPRLDYPGLRDDLLAKMMGRRANGDPLLDGASAASNNFNYDSDPRGQQCPFQAHIRRTNPRTEPADNHGRPVPRIMRRGMSYGPPHGSNEDGDRGVVFMAYNASIAEQFEVIQTWVNGGNSTGVASCQSDPLMGPARDEDPRTFLFRLQGETVRLRVPRPFVRLQWGTYCFVPSTVALAKLAEPAADAYADDGGEAEAAEEGRRLIEEVERLPRPEQALAWKTWFEDVLARDPDEQALAPKVWAAIRAAGGARRVPYGDYTHDGEQEQREVVLAASRKLVDEVLRDDTTYSVCGYLPRMNDSVGPIYLGLDWGEDYERQSRVANAAISSVTAEQAFQFARGAGRAYLDAFQRRYVETFPDPGRAVKLDLANDYIASLLANVCRKFFGLPDQPPLAPPDAAYDMWEGPWSWTPHEARRPCCPGDFLAPSSYIFYVDPVGGIERRGPADGKAIREAGRRHFKRMLDEGRTPAAPISHAVFDAFRGEPDADDMIGRTIIGAMMGFLPPADGNLRGALYDWIKSGQLWRIQNDLLRDRSRLGPYAGVDAILRPYLIKAMRKRPAPDAIWRTATKDASLGDVSVKKGDRIYVGIVSATAEQPARGEPDVFPIFGGNREAPGHPTHACPAYQMAMGTLLGAICALLEIGRIEALPAPLIVAIPRPSPPPAAA